MKEFGRCVNSSVRARQSKKGNLWADLQLFLNFGPALAGFIRKSVFEKKKWWRSTKTYDNDNKIWTKGWIKTKILWWSSSTTTIFLNWRRKLQMCYREFVHGLWGVIRDPWMLDSSIDLFDLSDLREIWGNAWGVVRGSRYIKRGRGAKSGHTIGSRTDRQHCCTVRVYLSPSKTNIVCKLGEYKN